VFIHKFSPIVNNRSFGARVHAGTS
jgi:hypothetical protein